MKPFWDEERLFILFGYNRTANPRVLEGAFEAFIRIDIQFLYKLTLYIYFPGQMLLWMIYLPSEELLICRQRQDYGFPDL